MTGQVILRRAAGERGTGKAGLGYLFLPDARGSGYAAEACEAALGWLGNALPGEPVVLFTQTASERSMRLAAKLGFTEAERFHAWDAEQWFGLRPPVTPLPIYGWPPATVLAAKDAEQAVLLAVDACGEPQRVGAAVPGSRPHRPGSANGLPVEVRTRPVTRRAK